MKVLVRIYSLLRVISETALINVVFICGFPTADVALSQKLSEELQYETESNASAEPEFLKSFNAQGVWKVCSTKVHERTMTLTPLIAFCRLRTLPVTMRLRLSANLEMRRRHYFS